MSLADSIRDAVQASPGFQAAQAAKARKPKIRDLQALEQQFLGLPQAVQEALLAQVMQAGTYGATPEFQAGFQTEAAARLRGVALDNVTRRQALERQLGLSETPQSAAGTLNLSDFQLPPATFGTSTPPAPPASPAPATQTPAASAVPPPPAQPKPPTVPKPGGGGLNRAGLSPKQQAIGRLRPGSSNRRFSRMR